MIRETFFFLHDELNSSCRKWEKNIYHAYVRLGKLSDSPFKFGRVTIESLVKHGHLK